MKLPFKDYNYVVDNNALITLMAHHPLGKPAYQAIWDEIESLIKRKNIFSTMVVYEEIMRYLGKDDRLKKWAKSHKKASLFRLTKKHGNSHKILSKSFPSYLI